MTTQQELRILVRGAYDLQKIRIQIGNRIVANYRVKLGQKPGKATETLDKEGLRIIKQMQTDFEKITDGVTKFPRPSTVKAEGSISNFTEFLLIGQYVDLERSEINNFNRLAGVLPDFPIYNVFLEEVKGCGPRMSGVIISEIDIHRAHYPSSLWRYAGLDVVTYWQREDSKLHDKNAPEKVWWRHPEDHGWPFHLDQVGPAFTLHTNDHNDLLGHYEKVETNVGRSRKKDSLIDVNFIDKDKKPAIRKSITFNPFLKTKLIGVLAPSFMMQGGSYTDYYSRKKKELQARADIQDWSDGRRHNASMRYMIKMFLCDLYNVWRPLEGLIVAPTYEEKKLRGAA